MIEAIVVVVKLIPIGISDVLTNISSIVLSFMAVWSDE